MSAEPFSFTHAVADFDLAQLPVDPELLLANEAMLNSAIQGFYEEWFSPLGGTSVVLIKEGMVRATWYPSAIYHNNAVDQVIRHAVTLINQGDFKGATLLLRAALAHDQGNPGALYNLGMLLSDQGQIPEAIEILLRLVKISPENAHGWTALGVAQGRNHDTVSAITSLQKALEVSPNDGYALRNLGGLLTEQSPDEALPLLERATRILPKDQRSFFAYANCLQQLGQTTEAKWAFQKVIEMDRLTPIAEEARKLGSLIAYQALRNSSAGQPLPSVVQYCLDALKKFRDLGDAQSRTVLFEVVMLGRDGLDLSDPEEKYSLRSLSGNFSGLALTALMYTGLKMIDPKVETGVDFSQELAQAKALLEATDHQ